MPWHDPFGANTGGEAWLEYSWLADIWLYLLDRLDPAIGLRLLQGVVATLTVGTVYFHASCASGRPRLALLLSAPLVIPLVMWAARPQMFSFLLTAATMLVLWWGQHRSRRVLWLLPPIMALWANLHIYFVVGLGLIWLVLSWPWLLWAAKDRRFGHLPSVLGLAVAAVATLAPLLNPYGIALYQDVLPLAVHASANWPRDVITELQSPDFHDWVGQVLFLWIAIYSLAFAALGRVPASLTLLLFFGLLFRALFAVRDIPFFIIVMLPLVAEHIAAARPVSGPTGASEPVSVQASGGRAAMHWLVVVILALLPVAVVAKYDRERGTLIQEREKDYPAEAVAYLLKHRPPGPLLNEFNWGGYLINKLASAYPVYIDGRNQLYGRGFWDEYNAIRECNPGWQKRLDATHARVILWRKDAPLSALLRLSPDWMVGYEGGEAIIFLKRSAK